MIIHFSGLSSASLEIADAGNGLRGDSHTWEPPWNVSGWFSMGFNLLIIVP